MSSEDDDRSYWIESFEEDLRSNLPDHIELTREDSGGDSVTWSLKVDSSWIDAKGFFEYKISEASQKFIDLIREYADLNYIKDVTFGEDETTFWGKPPE